MMDEVMDLKEQVRARDFIHDCEKTLEFLKSVQFWIEEAEGDGAGTTYEDKAGSIRDEFDRLDDAIRKMKKQAEEDWR